MPAFDSSLSITFLPENNHFFIGQILFFFALLSFTISIFALSHFRRLIIRENTDLLVTWRYKEPITTDKSVAGFLFRDLLVRFAFRIFFDPVCGPEKFFKKLNRLLISPQFLNIFQIRTNSWPDRNVSILPAGLFGPEFGLDFLNI